MKGTIEFVKTVEKGNKKFYSFKIGDKWYGSGIKSPGNKGDTIEFDVEENGSFLNAGNIKKVEGASVTNQAGASSTSGSTDWAAKDRSIAWQAARNSANALLADVYRRVRGTRSWHPVVKELKKLLDEREGKAV